MVEWFKAHAWKACELRGSAGSNPVLCAKKNNLPRLFFVCREQDFADFVCQQLSLLEPLVVRTPSCFAIYPTNMLRTLTNPELLCQHGQC